MSGQTRFGRVAVMFGGMSAEREVSLNSGQAVLDALKRAGVDAHRFDPAESGLPELLTGGFDRVFNVLHGPGGEDGVLQGALDWCDMPYTGSGVLASALALDKARSKALFQHAGLATPAWRVLNKESDALAVANELGYPLFAKPLSQGSSVGMTLVRSAADVDKAMMIALAVESAVMFEEFVDGPEHTVTILDDEALPSIRIETDNEFYDYDAKYIADDTRYICPGLGSDKEQAIGELALKAFRLLGCEGWGRVDFMTGPDGVPMIIEVNTVPGMTSHSLVPMAAHAAGMTFDQLCVRVLETTLAKSSAGSDVAREKAHGA